MNGELISIGDEILVGQIVNSNASTIAKMLNSIGVWVSRVLVVGDAEKEIQQAISESLSRVNIVLITGGLGPTRDDITRKVLCDIFKSELVYNEDVYAHIQQLFARRGIAENRLNRDQAMVPDKCQVLHNALGTAPGMLFRSNGKMVVAMPGVPFEMEYIMQQHVLSAILSEYQLPEIFHRTLVLQGTNESQLALKLTAYEDALNPLVKLAYLPSPGYIRLRLTYRPALGQKDLRILDDALSNLKAEVAEYLVTDKDEPVMTTIGNLLKENKKTLAFAESCTGGYMSSLATANPGSSAYFKGSVVAYDNSIKTNVIGVPAELIQKKGAVSLEVAEAMAEGVRKLYNVDYAIATSGIAGPDGGTPEKPVGTVCVAVSSATGTVSHLFNFSMARRDITIQRSANSALFMLYKELKKQFKL